MPSAVARAMADKSAERVPYVHGVAEACDRTPVFYRESKCRGHLKVYSTVGNALMRRVLHPYGTRLIASGLPFSGKAAGLHGSGPASS